MRAVFWQAAGAVGPRGSAKSAGGRLQGMEVMARIDWTGCSAGPRRRRPRSADELTSSGGASGRASGTGAV